MWIVRMRVRRTNDLAEDNKCRLREVVFLQNGIERDVFAVMTKLTVRHVINSAVFELRPIGAVRQKDKLRFWINEVSDQPRTRHAVDLDPFACDPFHKRRLAYLLKWQFAITQSCRREPGVD